MELHTLLLFIPACFALNMAPGPNNLLAMNNAQHYGFIHTLIAGMGRLVAFMIMIFLSATGLAAILYASESLFFLIKIMGALYLFWIAYQLWHSEVNHVTVQQPINKSVLQLITQEFLLAAGNPKAILIFTAFLPQFINPTGNTDLQFLTLGVVFLSLELTAVSIYACFGLYLRNWFAKPKMKQLFNRTCSGFLACIGISLLVERRN